MSFGLNEKPPAPVRKFNKTIELAKLQELADRLINDQVSEPNEELIQTEALLKFRTSMGGARPKAVVEDNAGLWLAKFSRPDDKWNNPRVEHAMLELARSCGINAARSRIETVAGKDILLVQRFDRLKAEAGYFRARMISGLTLLGADESPVNRSRWSYVLMVEELRRVVEAAKEDAAELFRRVCFNALISNTDDHPRNHALIAWDRNWKLAPAYDLTPSPLISEEERYLAMECGDFGRYANAKNLLSQCTRFLLDPGEAKSIVDEMTNRIRSSWYNVVRSHGVSEADAERIRTAFVYKGFELNL